MQDHFLFSYDFQPFINQDIAHKLHVNTKYTM